jgi:hypothetical protein
VKGERECVKVNDECVKVNDECVKVNDEIEWPRKRIKKGEKNRIGSVARE